jgi:uncharacterized protein (DUF3820 family)
MTHLQEHVIAERVIARQQADELHSLALDATITFTSDAALAFWKRMLEHVLTVLPAEHHPIRVVERGPWAAMTNEEAREFETKETMDFGIHCGKHISDVPWEYLTWLDEQQKFQRNLNRYLRNEHIERLTEDERSDE